jgi:competence protein ComEA
MPDPPELPPRPAPPRRLGDTVSAWLRWIGFGRLVGSAVSVVIVVGGAIWLLRPPAQEIEAALPIASGSAPVATLPVATPATDVTDDGERTEGVSGAGTTAPAGTAAAIVVHVAGAVAAPGVYTLPGAARAADAVAAAGGVTAEGDLDGLNLAASVVDGQRVYVPRLGEVDPASVPSGAGIAASAENGPTGTTAPARPLDLNTATAAELEALPGVGPSTAGAIVDDRTRNGPFASVDDLDRVPGIGPAKLEALRQLVTV